VSERTILKLFGGLFCILAVSNFTKPLEMTDVAGFVFLGQRLRGTPNLIMGPLFGLFLAAYGIGILRMRRYALPMAWIYAAWVIVNLVMFRVRMPEEAGARPLFGVIYAVVAIGVSLGAAILLTRNRAALR
jgi:hypothetical protein